MIFIHQTIEFYVQYNILKDNKTYQRRNTFHLYLDILKVNGFDERMTYGGLDRELGERLMNFGIKPIQIRHRSCVIHLHHKQGYNSKESWDNNRNIREEVQNKSLAWTNFGIDKNNAPKNK